jgi:hypothetical protein
MSSFLKCDNHVATLVMCFMLTKMTAAGPNFFNINQKHPNITPNATSLSLSADLFAPVASVMRCSDFEDALRQADDSKFALQTGVFTKDIDRVFKAINRLNFGGVIINDIPAFRADHMPYGSNRQSGLGREGVRFVMEEMTNIQMVDIRTASLQARTPHPGGRGESQGGEDPRRSQSSSTLNLFHRHSVIGL